MKAKIKKLDKTSKNICEHTKKQVDQSISEIKEKVSELSKIRMNIEEEAHKNV